MSPVRIPSRFLALPLITLTCESLRIDGRPFGGGEVAATRTAEFFNVLEPSASAS